MYSNRVLGAEISMPDIQSVCDDIRKTEATPSDEQQRALRACEQFTLWDQHVNLDSRGAHVFTEFWKALQSELDEGEFLIIDNDQLWKTDFDAADPIHTPRGFDTSINENHRLITKALSEAVLAVEDAGLALDIPFSEAQFFARNNEQIPIHGGYDDMGVFGVIKVRLDDGGYQRISGGNSYIQTVTWDETPCPIAQGILTHSQSTDPASPHYGDQTLVYADKGWIDLPFCAEAIKAAQIGETLVLKN
jgi:acyl-homoserine-lactone acylase